MYEMELLYIFRIMLAGICGVMVGLERRNRSKEAGIRTHFVVACGAAIIMIVSKYAFFDVAEIADKFNFAGEIRLDPSRVASTIASGIGFLGAGMYVLGIGATILILIGQFLMHIDFHRSRNARMKILSIKNVDEDGFQEYLAGEFSSRNVRIHTTSVELTDEGNRNYIFTIELPQTVEEDEIISLTKHKSSIKPCP
ncbi:MAG: MgtC/SapB family protein [Clostridia bacterium]|nr:MgtC/SapB family protein [Clostridia bacterium]